MAPMPIPKDTSSAPLADYFFIAGLESSSIFEHSRAVNGLSHLPLNTTIEEPSSADDSDPPRRNSVQASPEPKRNSKRFSWDKRKSVSSIPGLESRTPTSNRSSITIKAPHDNKRRSGGLTEDDFNAALKKFAADRDSVVAEITVSSAQSPPPTSRIEKPMRSRPKTQRFTVEDSQLTPKNGIGSVRRRLSTMNPLTRSGTTRRSSTRMSKRLSGYNSVIPAPQRFSTNANVHPLKRPYEPVLLDQYPSKDMKDELHKRSPFPDYIPMFVFPNDASIVSADERPRSTWHAFAMTTSDGSKLYGVSVILWMTLNPDAASELERQCEDWRRRNMTDEERELANSLAERLASERAKLSELLARLPEAAPDSQERGEKENEISDVEERISLMSEMLKPLRHAAASKIDGLTNGETGFWVPRAYGILGRDPHMTGFWKEWLRAVAVPMFQGVLRVPPSSPRIGMWQPLEKYVVNLCAEALSPITSRTQVELAIRELRMYARKDAINEIPGSRNVDIYALFRSLDIEVIATLFEFALAESRIIFLSSHTAMLHLASAALVQLMYPLKWVGVFIPVLPARLIQALEAPCPYIIGIDRKYENVDIPEDDIVLVDLDHGTLEASAPPPALPKQQRRKLVSILQLAAPHRYRYGVPVGPPKYAMETFPHDSFSSEYSEIFDPSPSTSNLAQLANLPSNQFGSSYVRPIPRPPVFNAFLTARKTSSPSGDRTLANAAIGASPGASPSTQNFAQTPLQNCRNDSANSLQASLREKRSGLFETGRRNSSFGLDRVSTMTGRRPSQPFHSSGHSSSTSISTLNTDPLGGSTYAPSVYAQSTLAASTLMPHVVMQPVQNSTTTQWTEGHCMKWDGREGTSTCSICDEKAEGGIFRCSGCNTQAHQQCINSVSLVCPIAFSTPQVLTAFLRCLASLFYTYRKYLVPTPRGEAAKSGRLFNFSKSAFLNSLPHDQADYMSVLAETQMFSEFVNDRETMRPDDPNVRLFDEIILSKRNRGKVSSVFGKSKVGFLEDKSDHLWRSAQATSPASRDGPKGSVSTGRMPAKLESDLLKEPRVVQGVPRVMTKRPTRKQVPSMLSMGRTMTEPAM